MWLIFLLMTSVKPLLCQVQDSFDPTLELSDQWIGDRDKFIISADGLLQLNDSGAGQAILYARSSFLDEMSWEAFMRMDFSPSNSNRLEYFLWSEGEDLENSDALLIRMGATGSDDTIELIRQSDGNRTTLAEGSTGLIGTGPVTLRLITDLNDGVITIEADDFGGVCFLPEIEIMLGEEIEIPTGDFFTGWICRYTSTRSQSFFFDDVYAGAPRIDMTPPDIDVVNSTSEVIQVSFTEVMDENSLQNASIQLTPDVGFTASIVKNQLILELAEPLSSSIDYELSISGLTDLSGNEVSARIDIQVAEAPDPNDLLLSEILFNPEGSNSDYIEIINVSDKRVDLSEIVVLNSQNSQEVSLSGLPSLSAGSYLVLTEDIAEIIQSFPTNDPTTMAELDIPALNNDDGNVTITNAGSIIDSYDYDEDDHFTLLDDVDGVSLERISLSLPNESSNWTSAALSIGGGTPGLPNSASGEASAKITIEKASNVFSPNGDGDNDLAIINYQLDRSDYITTIRLFNDRGQEISEIVTASPTSAQGQWVWDGMIDGQRAPIGIYILDISLFALDGSTFRTKQTIGLGDFLD